MRRKDIIDIKEAEFKLKSVLHNFSGNSEDKETIERAKSILENMIKEYEEKRNDTNNKH